MAANICCVVLGFHVFVNDVDPSNVDISSGFYEMEMDYDTLCHMVGV